MRASFWEVMSLDAGNFEKIAQGFELEVFEPASGWSYEITGRTEAGRISIRPLAFIQRRDRPPEPA